MSTTRRGFIGAIGIGFAALVTGFMGRKLVGEHQQSHKKKVDKVKDKYSAEYNRHMTELYRLQEEFRVIEENKPQQSHKKRVDKIKDEYSAESDRHITELYHFQKEFIKEASTITSTLIT